MRAEINAWDEANRRAPRSWYVDDLYVFAIQADPLPAVADG